MRFDQSAHGAHTSGVDQHGHGGCEFPSHFSTNLLHALAVVDATSTRCHFGSRPPRPKPTFGESSSFSALLNSNIEGRLGTVRLRERQKQVLSRALIDDRSSSSES